MEQEVTYETKMQEFELKKQLETSVSNWVEKTFNYIQVNVLNKYCDDTLYEYTLYPTLEDTFDDWLENCDVEIKIRDWIDEDTLYMGRNSDWQGITYISKNPNGISFLEDNPREIDSEFSENPNCIPLLEAYPDKFNFVPPGNDVL